VRRRNLPYKADVVGVGVRVLSDEFAEERTLNERLREFRLTTRFGNLRRRGSAQSSADMVATLASPKFALSRTLMDAAIAEWESQERVDRTAVLKVAARFATPQLGEGLVRLETANAALRTNDTIVRNLALSGAVPELDRLGRLVDATALATLARELEEVSRERAPAEIATFIKSRLEDIGQ
jgi:hypothetical protein